jgi:hypothetical protein
MRSPLQDRLQPPASVRPPTYLHEHMFSPSSNPRTDAPAWRHAVRRAVDLAVAFATLESATSARDLWSRDARPPASACPHGLLDASARHPHRSPLRLPARPGRPGAVSARAQDCLVPHAGRPRHRSAHPSVR